MSKHKVLVVDDDRKTVAMIRLYLEHEGYDVLAAYDGQQALDTTQAQRPDLIVLELMLPQIGGLDVCRKLRMESRVPIVMLTARATEEDKLRGLDLGADDYVTKPFSPRELVARVRAVLRRAEPMNLTGETVIRRKNIEVDLHQREVRVRGNLVSLTPTEFKLLEALTKSPGRVFSRQELVEKALGWDYDGLDRTVDAHVMNLRRKITLGRGQPSLIVTLLLSRRILGPIEALTGAARQMESGDLSQRVQVRSKDEIGALAHAFNAMADGLARTEQLRQNMVSDIAHELRTPLTNLRCQIEALQDGLSAPSASVFHSLHEEAMLLKMLIDDLQDLALAEAGQLRLECEPVSILETVSRAVGACSAQAEGKGIALKTDVPSDLPTVYGDAKEQVKNNL